MEYNSFSHSEYSEIIQKYAASVTDFGKVINKNLASYVLMRHDVEFSVLRALELAQIESRYSIRTTYNFQVMGHTYNPCSVINAERMMEIRNLGHYIGLHFYYHHIPDYDWVALEAEFHRQVKLLENITGFNCDRFSFHRPKSWVLEPRGDYMFGKINQYGKSFFEFSPNPKRIKYISDSRHEWCYGHPLNQNEFQQLQILTHPDEWTKDGLNEEENFRSILSELNQETRSTFLRESPKNYTKYIGII